MVFWHLMDFNPNDYVQRGSPQDNFPDGIAEIINCRYCGIAMLMRPWTEPDCGRHRNRVSSRANALNAAPRPGA
jgi:hypothetical protein